MDGPDDATARVRAHFDDLGEGEWLRLEDTPRGRVAFAVHRRMLEERIRPGDRVLEVGAGPGRFTIALAELGARVTVTDLSPVQLALNEEKVRARGLDGAVEQRLLLDVRDVRQRFGEDSFDAVVAYGGVLSYVFEDAATALEQLVLAVRPGGTVLVSVMSTAGSVRYFLPVVRTLIDTYGRDHLDYEIATGDLRNTPGAHTCQMYRWREIESLVAPLPCRIVAGSASNCMSLADDTVVAAFESDPELRAWFVEWEIRLCREPGCVDGGTHTLFALERTHPHER